MEESSNRIAVKGEQTMYTVAPHKYVSAYSSIPLKATHWQWRWRLKSEGRVVASAGGYNSAEGAMAAFRRTAEVMGNGEYEVVEATGCE